MSFGWSAGDIATATKLIYQISKALCESQGSSKDRHQAELFSISLTQAIKIIQEVQKAGLEACKDIMDSTTALKECYDELKGTINKYANLRKLGDEDWGDYWMRQIAKLKWDFFAKENVRLA